MKAMSNDCRFCKGKIIWCVTKENGLVAVDMFTLPQEDKDEYIKRCLAKDNTPIQFREGIHIPHLSKCTGLQQIKKEETDAIFKTTEE